MKELETFLDKIEKVMAQNGHYKFEAYSFVMAALHHTVTRLPKRRHITGQELLQGIREYSLEQFGALARTVLNYWGIKSTEDIGNIVFDLVENRILTKTDNDSLESFRNAYDFIEVFDQGYRQQLAKKISRMRSM